MSLPLDAATVLQALELELEHEPVDAEQVVDGSPTTGIAALTELDDWEVGVWEITPGTVTDVEVDEIFIVLRGHATLQRGDGSEVELVAGSVGRLDDGEETTWVVHDTLRKIYIA
ncbi:cupin domain-containing protein [Microcella sp.]|uniref:cupin domain-containing protein n=1 Tax=Microcella sp. TaxID=1913979 RepID=UPI0026137C8C|nr:cupin domain-containing protein [Microcella sp.]